MTLTLWRGDELLGELLPRSSARQTSNQRPGKPPSLAAFLVRAADAPPCEGIWQVAPPVPGFGVQQFPVEPDIVVQRYQRAARPQPHSGSGALHPVSPDEAKGVPVEKQLTVHDASGQVYLPLQISLLQRVVTSRNTTRTRCGKRPRTCSLTALCGPFSLSLRLRSKRQLHSERWNWPSLLTRWPHDLAPMQNQDWPYPSIDKPLPLANGEVVQLFNLFIFIAASGEKTLTIQYGTDIPQNERAALIEQAEVVATQLNEFADGQGIRRGNAQICRTRAQAETREAITRLFRLRETAMVPGRGTRNPREPRRRDAERSTHRAAG